jgi:probable rRNA maturation factor
MAAAFQLEVRPAGPVPAKLDVAPLRRLVAEINHLQPGWLSNSGRINLKLVDDAEIRALNKDYSGNDYATDVLSFSYIEEQTEPANGELGDIAISLETAQRQATEAGVGLEQEVTTLALHGILHIFGFDHEAPEAAAEMDHWQAKLLTAAGVPYRKMAWEF